MILIIKYLRGGYTYPHNAYINEIENIYTVPNKAGSYYVRPFALI